jgi:hypothetical protein
MKNRKIFKKKNRKKSMDLERIVLGLGTWLIIGGCASAPNIKDEDRLYNLMFTPLQQGLTAEYDTDGDGYGDYKLTYELVGSDGTTHYLELRAIQEDNNRDKIYSQDETTIIPTAQLEFESL